MAARASGGDHASSDGAVGIAVHLPLKIGADRPSWKAAIVDGGNPREFSHRVS
jgi:hypothetical protein